MNMEVEQRSIHIHKGKISSMFLGEIDQCKNLDFNGYW